MRPVESPAAVSPVDDQTRELQQPQMFRDRRLGYARLRRQGMHGALAMVRQMLEQAPSGRIRQRLEQDLGRGAHEEA